ncbi:hypothetical protein BC941DRAFT_207493 [Chlamydoabsidia padenii]|nr:hypothetical protein BC941DRAFT_207493 [Chlamydoabsidia padenii]
MTQDGLEQIFGQYIQTMEAFRPINLNEEDDDDDDDDDLWQDEEVLTPSDNQLNMNNNSTTSSTTVPIIMEYPLYAHSQASMSGDLLYQKDIKPLPERPVIFTGPTTIPTGDATGNNNTADTCTTTDDKHRRKSLAKLRNRLSWTSDTGLSANSAVAQTWANELMTMFDMEFQIDTSLTLNTAPKLPELPFSNQHKRRSRRSQRYSTDSFMNLIPAFESFDLEEIERRSNAGYRSRNMAFPPPPLTTPPHETAGFSSSRRRSSSQPVPMDTYQRADTKPGPTRSSSLKYNKSYATKSHQETTPPPKQHKSTDIIHGLVNAFTGVTAGEKKGLSKKKSIRRLTALVTGTTHHTSNSNHGGVKHQAPPSPTQHNIGMSTSHSTSRLSIASTSTTLSTNSVVMVATKTSLMQYKPLPRTPSSSSIDNNNRSTDIKRRTSYSMVRPVVVEVSDLRRSRSVGYRPKKKRKSLETTKTKSIKRSSGQLVESSTSSWILDNISNNHNPSICISPSEIIPPIPPSSSSSSSTTSLPIISTPIISTPSMSSATLNDQLLTDGASVNPVKSSSSSTSTSSISAYSSSSQPSLASVSLPPSAASLVPPQPKRSKSTLMKLGSGLTKKAHRKNSMPSSPSSPSSMPEMEIDMAEGNFVKRMASLGKRMKLQRV